MLISFFVILPSGPLRLSIPTPIEYEAINDDDETPEETENLQRHFEHEHLLASSVHPSSDRNLTSPNSKTHASHLRSFKANLERARGLFFP